MNQLTIFDQTLSEQDAWDRYKQSAPASTTIHFPDRPPVKVRDTFIPTIPVKDILHFIRSQRERMEKLYEHEPSAEKRSGSNFTPFHN